MVMQVIEQGPRNLVVRFSGAGPDTVTLSTLSPPCQELRIVKIIQDVPADESVTLAWDADTDVNAWTSNGHAETHCFEFAGGLVNNAGAGVNGNVIYTGTAGANLVVHFKKVRLTTVWN